VIVRGSLSFSQGSKSIDIRQAEIKPTPQLTITPCITVTQRLTEHQLFEVGERSIFIDFSPSSISNAFLNLFSNVFSLLQALWQVR
jgi:hypothetical protein